jgi:hypothetical protein
MKRFSLILCLAVVFFLAPSTFAQTIEYLGSDYSPATASNYTYKRVFRYKEPIINPNLGTGYYGGITSNPQPTGLHICTVTDYYKTGEIALVGKVPSTDLNCSQHGGFDGQLIAYYKDGTIKRKEPWRYGKLNGLVIYYDETGNETARVEYVNGNRLEESKFSAPADSPIIGTWKYVECYNNDCSVKDYGVFKSQPTIVRTSTFTYSQNGIVESRHERQFLQPVVIKGNWKYTPKSASSGILEEYQGENLVERDSVRFLNRNQLEYTITFSPNSDAVGRQTVWTRQ